MADRVVFSRDPETQAPGDYPTADWASQRSKYWEYWRHFDGGWLDSTVSDTDTSLKYPLRLNPYNMPCLLHAGFLFGEVQDGNDPLVEAVVEPWGRETPEADRELGAILSDFLNRVWYENDGRALQQEAGLISQILGGCIFGAFYDPSREADGQLPIRLEHVLPEYFFPVPAPTRHWELPETFVCYEITRRQAKLLYGVDASYENALYQEWWRGDHYEITVEGHQISWGGLHMTGVPLGGQVPYTYIPHLRAGEFYGISLLHGKQEIAQEINERLADVGDIVSENARMMPAIKNTRKITVNRMSHGVPLLNLGQAAPGMDPPEIVYPNGVTTDNTTVTWALDLLNIARTEAYTPPVLYGIDEGSQRSSLTLALRALPLLVHMRQERTLWTAGLNRLARLILLIAAEKGLDVGGGRTITRDDLNKMRIWQEWAPIMPRDHDQLVNEMIMRINSGLVAPETALNRMGDIRDIQTEMNLIKAWMEYTASTQMPMNANPFGGTGAQGEQAGLNRPSQPQPSISKEE